MSFSRTQHSDAGRDSHPQPLGLKSSTLPLSHCAPWASSYVFLCTGHLYPLLPHLQGWAGIVTFQSPCISPTLWGHAYGNNSTLSPALHYRISHQGKCPNVITPALPWHCRDNQKVLALHHSRAIPPLSPKVWGGCVWIQMTCELVVN